MYPHLYLLIAVAGLLCQTAIAQENTVTSGNYRIQYCGIGPGSKAARLQTLLPQFRNNLKLVLADVKRGTTSKAYQAYFKSQANAAKVESIFQAIADGIQLHIAVPGAPSKFYHPVYPTMLCLDPSMPNVAKLQAVCMTTRGGGKPAASIIPHSQFMVLCPDFWHLRKGADRTNCPQVKRNKFVPDDHRIMINKFGVFVHEFAHAYTHKWDPKEIYSPMDAVKLSAKHSLKNANNFALYAASEYFPLSAEVFSTKKPNGKLTEAIKVSLRVVPNTLIRISSGTRSVYYRKFPKSTQPTWSHR
ncbi:MAG: hypothetical protein LQ337_001919 [Flavoplaca oasis]|nr:MAG: hypothetical protein LQ337_001919 [Flavoplaca oasis]